ncbi:PREDICTED: FERM, RhoGEF and pleckstrin domain-containing protein 2-like [Acropora digitifera]|uniref:FERM, RhoGEF and pleckstrin domain-containing protein 2-like n=1 Tax=Acropora digitifera TaxID=70779 RepID=UPI00077A714F|nr:PREDICTED: FERM, RhoGEF and pleckstrin domain-containing protein 2-like [Acropora digitifera]
MSPPVSPSTPTPPFIQKGAYISKELYGAAYSVVQELLNTERTYVKDLEVVTIAFRDVVADEGVLPEPTKNLLFSTFDPIYDFHCAFLSELEQRMALWNASGPSRTEGTPRIGDLILRNMKQIKRYLQHIRKHDQVMQELEEATKKYKDFEVAYKEFEVQVSLSHCQPFSRRCYLPPLPDRNHTPP